MNDKKTIKRKLEKFAHTYWILGENNYSKIDGGVENYISNCVWSYFEDKNISKLTNKFEKFYEKQKSKLKSKYINK